MAILKAFFVVALLFALVNGVAWSAVGIYELALHFSHGARESIYAPYMVFIFLVLFLLLWQEFKKKESK